MNVGIIGCGLIGRKRAQAIGNGHRLVAVADSALDRAEHLERIGPAPHQAFAGPGTRREQPVSEPVHLRVELCERCARRPRAAALVDHDGEPVGLILCVDSEGVERNVHGEESTRGL